MNLFLNINTVLLHSTFVLRLSRGETQITICLEQKILVEEFRSLKFKTFVDCLTKTGMFSNSHSFIDS